MTIREIHIMRLKCDEATLLGRWRSALSAEIQLLGTHPGNRLTHLD